ncbi:hypothetical protein B7Y94_03185 [Candidatus Saccharibacteria bacterium 32-49-12]|nr:MAG: hypothetical protein B7Y94_03185 [Candidatus Saccharibacteria bacterium 32-49-12]
MTPLSKPIVFFGTDDFSVSALEHLIAAGYPVVAVVTKPDSRSGRGQHLTDIETVIAQIGDCVGILSSYGRIVPQKIIDLFNPGIINIHPSLLPKYRGPSPVETAIYDGVTETGVSLMLLTAAMDAGPVYAQATYPLTGHETQPELERALADLGSSLLIHNLPHILDGTLLPQPQDDALATYTKMLSKDDSRVEPLQMSAAQLARKVRAHVGFPKTKITLSGGQTAIVTRASDGDVPQTPLDVVCADERYLIIEELVAPTGRRLSATDWINGYGRPDKLST